MRKKRIEMLDIKHLLRLKQQGRSNRQIGELLGIHRNTVNSYVLLFSNSAKSYEELSALDNAALLSLINGQSEAVVDERYAYLKERFNDYELELKKVGATQQAIWESYHVSALSAGIKPYSYTQFRTHFKAYLRTQQVSLYWTHKYGDKLFVDFCGKKLPITDKATGAVSWQPVFVGILGGSGYTFVKATEDERLPSVLEAMQDCFQFIGGVPQAVVPDNMKTAVTKADDYEAQVNLNFKALALHYSIVVLPTRARKPKDKALVEGAVKLVYQRIFYPLNELVFYNIHDLNEAISAQLDQYNNRLYQYRDYSRKSLFDSQEKHLLEALPNERYEARTYQLAYVNKDAHVRYDYHYYSVPYAYVGRRVRLQITHKTLEVFECTTHQRLAIHPRSNERGGFSTKDSHLPDNVRFVKNWSEAQFTEIAKELGTGVEDFFAQLFSHKAHPEQAYKACMGILNLRKGFSDQRIEAACVRATYFQNYSYLAIKNILEKSLDTIPYRTEDMGSSMSDNQVDEQSLLQANHPNIRGSDYYQ